MAETVVPQPVERRARRRPAARRRVASGIVWIGVLAVLLAGVVAVNVAVLQLNLRLDDANRERTQLRVDIDALRSQLASAASPGRTQVEAERRGLVPADPSQTIFVDLRR